MQSRSDGEKRSSAILDTEHHEDSQGRDHPQAGKAGQLRVRAYQVVSLLVDCTAAHLIADYLERRKGRGLHDGQFGCRKRRFCVDAAAVLMNHTKQALA